MTRHIIDKPKPASGNTRTRAFVKIEREAQPQAASRQLQERPKRIGPGRLKEFLRIERGEKA